MRGIVGLVVLQKGGIEMASMPPMIIVRQSGEVVVDFMPALEESTDELSLKGTRDGEVVTITRKEWHPVVTGYDLVRIHHRKDARWEIQKVDNALFWEAFDDQWQQAPFMDISPGLIVHIFSVEYQGIRHSAQGATWWEDRSGFDQETLAKLRSLKNDDNREQLRALMKRLGEHLLVKCMLENFVEWTAMGIEAGHKPSFRVPYPKITKEDALEIARGIKESLGWRAPEWLPDREKEKQAVIAFVNGLENTNFNSRRAITKLIYLCWNIWPKYPPTYLVQDGISEWFIKKAYQELKVAASS